MYRRHLSCMALVLVLVGTGLVLASRVWSDVVAEWSFAVCADWQNCGNCILARDANDMSCASGTRCIAFKGTPTQHTFKACIPNTDGNNHCEVDDSENPDIWCQGFYKRCGCFDANSKTCPNAPCDCNWGRMPDGAAQLHVNGICKI